MGLLGLLVYHQRTCEERVPHPIDGLDGNLISRCPVMDLEYVTHL
jgi:hypothetical protein